MDDQPQVRRGLRMSLSLEPDFVVIGEARNGVESLRLAKSLLPDVIVMEIALPDMNGIMLTECLYDNNPRCVIIVLSINDDTHTRARSLAAGAGAFVSKRQSPEVLITTIRHVVNQFKSS